MITITSIKEKRQHIFLKFTEGCCFLECQQYSNIQEESTACSSVCDDGSSSFSEILV